MARNQEKAQSMLNRWLVYKRTEAATEFGAVQRNFKRPSNPFTVESVSECDRWRMQIIRDIGRRIMDIQNESLGEQRIRDINDEINRMLKEKSQWEKRIIELGGPDFRKYERIADEQMGLHDPTLDAQKGFTYKYFGAARNLPGVKELLEKSSEPSVKRARNQKGINADYYGYRDDEDAELEKIEQEAERKAVAKAQESWSSERKSLGLSTQSSDIENEKGNADFVNNLSILSKQQYEQLVVDKRKQELLKKYISEELQSELAQQKNQVEVVLGKRKQ